MSAELARYRANAQKAAQGNPRPDLPKESDLSAQDRAALAHLRKDAKAAGATLETSGRGGLNPGLAYHVFKRDGFRCKRCGSRENLTLHHKWDLENPPPRLAKEKARHSNDPNMITTLCATCHDAVHQEDRAESAKGET